MPKHIPFFLSMMLVSTLAAGCSPSPRRMLEEYLEGRQAGESSREATSTAMDPCTQELSQWLDEAQPVDSTWNGSGQLQILATYAVSGDKINLVELPTVPAKYESWQQDDALQQLTWERITTIIPSSYRLGVTRFVLFSDGPAGALGAVEQPDQPGEWTIAVDIQDAQELPTLAATLIHETAHLFSLGPAQVETYLPLFEHPQDAALFAQGDAACETYFVHEGCSLPDSHLNQFFNSFWVGIYDEWSEIPRDEDFEARTRLLVKFHDRHADEFVSPYAATSPEEDLAESFLYFVLSSDPIGGSPAEDKIRFFQQFPGLVELRQQMRNSLCTLWEP